MIHVRRLMLGIGILLLAALIASLLIGMLWGLNWVIGQNPRAVAIGVIVILVLGFAYWMGYTLWSTKEDRLPALISIVGVLAIFMVMLATTILPR